jgi:hypothetical protein
MQVIPSQYEGKGVVGDFGWMIESSQYDDALFIFNDNEEDFLAYQNNKNRIPGSPGCEDGGGNAAIRHYRCVDSPRAAGVPTGWRQTMTGYPALTPAVQHVLDEAFAEIQRVLASGRYQRVYYSANPDGSLATKIFSPGDDVKRYIVDELYAVAGAIRPQGP